jgi:hypothetical protein
MDEHMFCIILRDVQAKMGLVRRKRLSPFRPKRFRHIFRDACATAGLDPGYTQAFMGHASDMSAIYLNKPRGVLEAQYIRVEPYLTIYKTGIDEDITLINAQLEEARKEMDELRSKMLIRDDMMFKLQREVKETRTEYEKLKGEMEEFKSFIFNLLQKGRIRPTIVKDLGEFYLIAKKAEERVVDIPVEWSELIDEI